MRQITRTGSSVRGTRVTPGSAAAPPPSETWAIRTDIPAAVNPAGTLWSVEKEWTFEGTLGAAPPVPWHTGIEWSGPHANLGGHVWRDQVNLDSMAYLDGSGALVLKLDWNATYQTAVGAYLITDQDGSTVRPGDYRLTPAGEDGVWIEFEVALPETQPSASWAAAWTYATVDDTPLGSGLDASLREEIDVFEKVGNSRPYYQQRFATNTHGRQASLLSDCAADEGLPAGEGFAPVAGWGGAAPNDGQPHKWGLMWLPGAPGEQRFFYDGHQYASRPKSGDTVHNRPHGLRLSWETEHPNPFGGGTADPSTETAYFPREMKVYRVAVIRRRLPATLPPSGSKPTEAPILQAKGLSLVWQDRHGDGGGPTSDWDFFQATQGSRNANDDPAARGFPGEQNQRLSLVTYDNKPCMKVEYPANQHGWLNYRSQHLPTHYRELGLCVDIKFPAGFDLRNTAGASIAGKTLFGLMSGPADHHKPGSPVRPSDTRWPEDQYGSAHGINWKYDPATPGVVKFEWYPHAVGAVVGGVYRWRVDNYSRLHLIPGYPYSDRWDVSIGSWHRFELYGRMDTNKGDGLLQAYLDGVLVREATNLDLGGWYGDRGLRARSTGNGTNGDGSISAGTGSLANTGGNHKFVGVFIREMIGGSTSLASMVPRFGGAHYAYNWRVYGKA